MKRLIMTMAVVLGVTASASAYELSFGDGTKYWAGWTGHSSYNWNDDTIDVVGNPDISGGVATVSSNGILQSVRFNYSVSPVNDWAMLAPGSLFINVLNGTDDLMWDYVVNTIGTPGKDPNKTSLAAGNYGVYGISVSATKGVNDASYILSGKDLTGAWSGYVIRDNHPIGIQAGLLTSANKVGDVGYTGFPNKSADNPSVGVSTYDFTQLLGGGLDLHGKDFIVGWEMTCANDVIYERLSLPPKLIPPPPAVPEPSTIALVGVGLAGAVFFRRRNGR